LATAQETNSQDWMNVIGKRLAKLRRLLESRKEDDLAICSMMQIAVSSFFKHSVVDIRFMLYLSGNHAEAREDKGLYGYGTWSLIVTEERD
jgi:hypothetical protein